MGKKVKRDDESPQTPGRRLPPPSYPPDSDSSSSTSDSDSSSSSTDEERGRECDYFRQSIDPSISKDFLLQIQYVLRHSAGCGKCSANLTREQEKCTPLKKIASATALDRHHIWVCLDCCQCYCSGAAEGSVPPQGHAQMHALQESHPWAAKFTVHTFCWCFNCNAHFMFEELEGSPMDEGDAETDCNLEQGKEVEGSVSETVKGSAVRGLRNLGNTCYFNSVVQNLLAMETLQCCLVSLNGSYGPLTRELMNLFTETGDPSNSEGPPNPKPLFQCICDKLPEYCEYQQQDSHELLRHLLDLLDKEVSSSSGSIVDNIFGGQLLNIVTCSDCLHSSKSFEPFLDVSLPVPLKKPSAKKDPHSTPNKTTSEPSPEMDPHSTPNIPMRRPSPRKDSYSTLDRSMGERKGGTEAGGDKHDKDPPGIDLYKTMGSGASNCCEPCASSSELKQTVVILEENPKGMCYSGSTAILDTADSVSWEFELPVLQCSVRGQICEDNNSVHSTPSSPNNMHPHPPKQTASSNSSGLSSCRNDSHSSCTPPAVCSVVKKLGARTVSVTCCKQTKRVIGTISNLVNELEVTSAPNINSGEFPEMSAALWGGSSSEHYLDHSKGKFSVDECLGLFTNQELLSDGRYCTHCNKKAPDRNDELRTSEQQAAAMVDPSKAFEYMVDVGEVGSKKALPLDMGCTESANFKVSDDMGELIDPNVEVEVSHSPVSSVGRLSTLNCKVQQDKNANILELPSLRFRNDACCQNILQKDDGAGGLHLTANPSISPNHPKTPQSYCDNDNFSKVNQEGSDILQLSDELSTENDIKDEVMESQSDQIKRNATKRIAIYRAPCILTIHLKRFIQDNDGIFSKLKCHISFNEVLDLTPFMDSSCEEKGKFCYDLIGLVEHSGEMTGGHYVAYVRKNSFPGKDESGGYPAWFRVSDDQVQEVSSSEVLEASAYILFYERI